MKNGGRSGGAVTVFETIISLPVIFLSLGLDIVVENQMKFVMSLLGWLDFLQTSLV